MAGFLAKIVKFRRQCRWIGTRVWARTAPLIASLEPRRPPLAVTPGALPLAKKVVVFCHFDRHGHLLERVRRYLEALRALDFSIVFVTNSGRLDPEAQAWLHDHCSLIMVRRNVGYDFAAWRDGIEAASLPAADTELLIIANDSVYGPLSPLAPLLARMEAGEADVWSLTDTWQIRYHLQSYFVIFTAAAFRSEVFRRFWRHVPDLRSKLAVIRHLEVGLTQAMLAGGFRCQALWPYVGAIQKLREVDREAVEPPSPDVRPLAGLLRIADERHERAAALRLPMNPTAELWRPLLLNGYPFLKRELVRENPAAVPDVAAWLELVQAISPIEADVILRDLTRSLRNIAP